MNRARILSRREFLSKSARAGAAAFVASAVPAPMIFTPSRSERTTAAGTLLFRPEYVQKGVGPHLLDWAYASDERWDAFPSDITASREGLRISDTGGEERFGINVRWNVEGFGYTYITADNGGMFYEVPAAGKTRSLNLNFELAKSRVMRNRRRMREFGKQGWTPSRESKALADLANEYFDSAEKARSEGERGSLAQTALMYSLWTGEMIELEKARSDITLLGSRSDYSFGCDARAFYQMYQDRFLEWFPELFDYAMITYVIKGDGMMSDFEPEEGKLNFGTRDLLMKKLAERGVKTQGRTLFWFYRGVTPEWLSKKSFDELKKYVEQHTRETLAHYAEGPVGWEIFNEFHDWAVEVPVTREQTIELTKLACDVAKATNPNVHRIINNCCPFAEYVQTKKTSGHDATYRQRTPWQFTKELVDAGVDFTMLGQQMYFPYRDLQDIVVNLERLSEFGKPVQLSEVGVSGGPTNDSMKRGRSKMPTEPFPWHRPWDEELQADWLEGIYTLAYSKPWIKNCNWFDFIDPRSYLENGGLLRSEKGEKKAAWQRLKRFRELVRKPIR